jgi:hypothetical protein
MTGVPLKLWAFLADVSSKRGACFLSNGRLEWQQRAAKLTESRPQWPPDKVRLGVGYGADSGEKLFFLRGIHRGFSLV